MTLKDKIQAVRDSVVAIGVLLPPNRVNIIGSGFSVIDGNHLLTADHLFQNLTEQDIKNLACMVATNKKGPLTGYSWLPIEIVRRENTVDAALLKIKNDTKTPLKLKPLEIGDDLEVQEGQEVYFTGYPYAANLMNDGFGVTLISNRGIISSVKYSGQEPYPLDWFFVDAISNPGNSGCPLFDFETNKIIGIMSISFRIQSKSIPTLDIREPMHIAGAKPIKIVKTTLGI